MISKNIIRRQEPRETSLRGSGFMPLPFDRLFDRWFNDFSLAPWGSSGRYGDFATPCVDVCEDEKEILVSAELPGIDEKDIQVSLSKDRLVLQGQKKEDAEEEGKDFYRHERSFGSVYREIDLPTEVDVDHAKAEFKKGILTLTLPKTGDHRGMRKIPVKAAA